MSTTPPLSGDQAEQQTPAHGTDPDGARRAPRWPAWTAPVAFVSGMVVAIVLAGVVIGVASGGEADPDAIPAGALIGSTVIQNLVLLGAAVGFAWITARPWPQDFGLRTTRLWPAVGWAALSVVGFLVVTLLLTVALGVEESPTGEMLDELGVGSGAGGLIAVALLICVVAPLFEELFFRGFFFTALRSAMNAWWAAILGGLAFGSIHILNFVGGTPFAEAIVSTVSLSVFGFLLCLAYWRTGSLYPCIAAHAVNNTVAFVVSAELAVLEGIAVAAGTAVVLTAVLLAVRPLGRRRPAAAAPSAA